MATDLFAKCSELTYIIWHWLIIHCLINIITYLRISFKIKADAIVVPFLPHIVALITTVLIEKGFPVKAFAIIRIGSRGFNRVFGAVFIKPALLLLLLQLGVGEPLVRGRLLTDAFQDFSLVILQSHIQVGLDIGANLWPFINTAAIAPIVPLLPSGVAFWVNFVRI